MSVIAKHGVFLSPSCTSCIGFYQYQEQTFVYEEKKGLLFIYHYSTSAPTSHRANKRRHHFHTQVPCCLFLHHIMCQLCLLPNSSAFNTNELWSDYKSLNYLIHPIWIMQASAYNHVSACCMHYTTWLLNTAQGSMDWCVFQDETH